MSANIREFQYVYIYVVISVTSTILNMFALNCDKDMQ